MKTLSELTKEEKAQLLQLIANGDISHDELNENTLFIETSKDWFTGLMMSIKAREQRKDQPLFIILNPQLKNYIESWEKRFLENIERKRNFLDGYQNFNVLNLGPGAPSDE